MRAGGPCRTKFCDSPPKVITGCFGSPPGSDALQATSLLPEIERRMRIVRQNNALDEATIDLATFGYAGVSIDPSGKITNLGPISLADAGADLLASWGCL